MPIASIEEGIERIRSGKMVIVVDDADRENEGDLVMAAEKATPEAINVMARYGRGLICLPITGERLDELGIPMMVNDNENTSSFGTAFTTSVDAKTGITTGISAYDRATTIRVMIDPNTREEDIARPGHVFPLRAREGGVLVRAGHTESAVDLARLAGLYPAGVICEVMAEDGTMARLPKLEQIAEERDIPIITLADLIAYRYIHEKLVKRVGEANLPTKHGDFRVIAYTSDVDPADHLALVKGEIDSEKPTLVRVHSQCTTGDVFGSLRCDCGEQVAMALRMISEEGAGVFVYMRQEGRGIGLHNKIRAYALQDQGLDTVEANIALGFAPDLRDYGVGAQILMDLGVRKMRLLTNNPKKIAGLEGYGLSVTESIPLMAEITPENFTYLETKQNKFGHTLNIKKEEGK